MVLPDSGWQGRRYPLFTGIGRARAIPFLKSEHLDINEYVVSKALDGLFYVLAEEERKIRKDPAARITELLKEVFGK